MAKALENPAKERKPYNYSIEVRIGDIIREKAQELDISKSEFVNRLLKKALGIVN